MKQSRSDTCKTVLLHMEAGVSQKRSMGGLTVYLALLALWVLASLAYTWMTTPLGYVQAGASDKPFHLSRLVEAFLAFKQHKVAYIATTTFGGNGQGVNFFYPYAGLLPYLLAMLITVNVIHALFIGTMIRTFVGLFVAYLAARILHVRIRTSALFSIVYVFSAYGLYDAVARYDLGEMMAIVFLPLVFALFHQVLVDGCRRRLIYPLGLAISLALVTYSHLLTTVLTIGVLLFLFIGYEFYSWHGTGRLLLHCRDCAIAAVMYLLMTAAFYLPLIDQLVSTPTQKPELADPFGMPGIANPSLAEILGNSLSNELGASQVTIGFLGVIGIVALLVCFTKLRRGIRFIFILGLVFLFVSTNIFPWATLQKSPIAILQFPSRFIPYASLFILYSVVVGLGEIFDSCELSRRGAVSIFVAALLIPLILAKGETTVYFHEQQTVPLASAGMTIDQTWGVRTTSNENWLAMQGISYKDYMPLTDKATDRFVRGGDITVDGKKVHLKQTDVQPDVNEVTYRFTSQRRGMAKIAVPFWIYKAEDYVLTVNGRQVPLVGVDRHVASGVGQLNRGLNVVKVEFKEPLSYRLSNLISLISMIAGLVMVTVLYAVKRGRNVSVEGVDERLL